MTTDTNIEENIRNLDIESLALNPKFGSLKFNEASKRLHQIRDWIIEFEQLNFKEKLPDNISNHIEKAINKFNEHIEWLKKFDIESSSNPKQEHDNFEAQINNFFNEYYSNFVVNHLTFLKQEAELKDEDKKKIREEQKELSQLRKKHEELVAALETKKEEIESTSGEIAAITFGKHFESEVKFHKRNASSWLTRRNQYFKWLRNLILINFALYLVFFITNFFNIWPNIKPSEFFTLEYALVNFALLSLLTYAISFSSRNYSVNSNLKVINLHRKNVAETMNDFLVQGDKNVDFRLRIIEKGTDAMFKHLPIGYLSKNESNEHGVLSSLMNGILKK